MKTAMKHQIYGLQIKNIQSPNEHGLNNQFKIISKD
jgi:hypothetical protein